MKWKLFSSGHLTFLLRIILRWQKPEKGHMSAFSKSADRYKKGATRIHLSILTKEKDHCTSMSFTCCVLFISSDWHLWVHLDFYGPSPFSLKAPIWPWFLCSLELFVSAPIPQVRRAHKHKPHKWIWLMVANHIKAFSIKRTYYILYFIIVP